MPEPTAHRDLRLDFFRGLSLIFIFIDHVPENVLTYFTLQATTFFDAAEVFIFISGFTTALVFGRRLRSKGPLYATAGVLRRAWQLYIAHVFLFVLFIAEVSYTAATFNNPMYTEEMRVAAFLDEPYVAVAKALMLEFQPAFLDILPLYIVMLLIFPPVLLAMQRHWLLVLVPSAIVYLTVQIFDISVPAYPAGHVWFFNPLAWQLLFIGGALLGDRAGRGQGFGELLRLAYPVAAVLFIASFVVKLSWTVHSILPVVPGLFLRELWPIDKNNLSPIRLLPFLALAVLVAVHVPRDARFLTSVAARPLVLCGQQSLELFCLGILLSALGHFVLAQYNSAELMQLTVNLGGITAMFLTARTIAWYKAMDRAPLRQAAPAHRGDGGAS